MSNIESQTKKCGGALITLAFFAALLHGPQLRAEGPGFTGFVVQHRGLEGEGQSGPVVYQEPTHSSSSQAAIGPTALELQKPLEMEVPTIAGDFNDILSNDSGMQNLEEKYESALRSFSIRNGFYATTRDSHRSVRPGGMSLAQEEAVRESMAKSLRQYMILRGLPEFLKSRESTKEIGEMYSGVISKVNKATRFKYKTKNNWNFGMGVNPFTYKSWMNYANDDWKFEAYSYLDSNDKGLLSSHTWGSYRAQTAYNISSKILVPSIHKHWNKNLGTSIETAIPVASNDVWKDTVSRFKAAYSF